MPARMQGMAAQYASCGEPTAFERTEPGERLYRVLRARRMEAAARPEQWAEPALVAPQDGDEQAVDHGASMRPHSWRDGASAPKCLIRKRVYAKCTGRSVMILILCAVRLPQVSGQGITARFPVTREQKDKPLVAAKKPAKKAAKAGNKGVKPAAKKALAKRPVAKKPASKKPVARKVVARKAAASKAPVKKAAASKPVPGRLRQRKRSWPGRRRR